MKMVMIQRGYKSMRYSKAMKLIAFPTLIILSVTIIGAHSLAAPALAQPSPALDELPQAASDDGEREVAPMNRREQHRKMRRERMLEEPGEGPDDEGRERGKGGLGREGRARRLGNFINFMNNFHSSMKDPYQATGLAILGIKDSFRKQGKPLDAIPMLEEYLGATKDQGLRNLFLFNMRQIYEEADRNEKALELNKQILKENFKAIEPKKDQS